MSDISRANLFGRLNATILKAVETATGFCRMRGNPYVELVHWLHVLLQDPRNDLGSIRIAFGMDEARLAKDVLAALDALPRGATAVSDFSPQIEEAIEKGWLFASLQFGAGKVRGAHLLYGMLKTQTLKNGLAAISPEWRKVNADKLGESLETICQGSSEATEKGMGTGGPASAASGDLASPTGVLGNDALEKFSIDLTAKAKSGEIDRIVGRDAEIRQVVDILLRRRQNNPILVGEAGVGKTAVVEGFARRIADGDVPPSLRNVTLRSLDIGLLQAGASVKGEFEKRLRDVIDAVEQSAEPIILFIDEAHTLIGAGGQAGTGDAANLLKPALARGRLRTIAATTYAEYRQYFEKDPALTRRFQTVDVGEPETGVAISMLRSVAPMMEKHHVVVVLDEAVEAAVKLSQRYVPARQLPDKAVSLLDTACARVAVSQHSTPAPVEDRRRRVELLGVEREIVVREAANQYASDDRLVKLDLEIAAANAALAEAEAKWDAEQAAFTNVSDARDALVAARTVEGADAGAEQEALATAVAAMREAGGDAPMVFGVADADAVASVVGDWTGIPVGRMVKDEIASVLTIGDQLKRRVVGQDHAMDAIAKRIQTSRAKLDNPNKPVGVFMLCGPSGVGKTETAHALSELLYSGDDSLIVINMSEFQEAHTVSTLKGAPAGYVGYGQGGVLTEAVRRRPYSVVLLDEVEKAHPDVHEMFFQVFDKGFMNDSEGRFIDFKNTLILLTSNVGTEMITTLSEDEEMKPEPDALAQTLRPDLLKVFPPALLGRLLVLPYYPLSPAMLRGIVRLQLNRIVMRIAEHHGIMLTYAQDLIDHIVARCTEVASGGRMIDAILTNTMLPDMSIALLERQMRGEEVTGIAVGIERNELVYRFAGEAANDVAAVELAAEAAE